MIERNGQFEDPLDDQRAMVKTFGYLAACGILIIPFPLRIKRLPQQ